MTIDSANEIEAAVWGPYSKKYHGISHIPSGSRAEGSRVDFTFFPTLAYAGTPLPNVCVPSGVHLIEANEDTTFYTTMHELEFEGALALCSYAVVDEGEVIVRIRYVNDGNRTIAAVVNSFASLEYPSFSSIHTDHSPTTTVIDAVDYDVIVLRRQRPWQSLVPDAMRLAEIQDSAALDGRALGEDFRQFLMSAFSEPPFGAQIGDVLHYSSNLVMPYADPAILIRYRHDKAWKRYSAYTETSSRLRIKLITVDGVLETVVDLPETDDYRTECAYFQSSIAHTRDNASLAGADKATDYQIEICTEGGLPLTIDCLLIDSADNLESVRFSLQDYELIPEIHFENGQLLNLHFNQISQAYTMRSYSPYHQDFRLRSIDSGVLEDAMISKLSNPDPTFDNLLAPFSSSFNEKRSQPGYFANLLSQIHDVEPGQTLDFYFSICNDQLLGQVSSDEFRSNRKSYSQLASVFSDYEYRFRMEEKRKDLLLPTEQRGRRGIHILEATLLQNVVYPIRSSGQWIIHHTPGKRWDSLYTWDSGFIALGLLEVNPDAAKSIIELYLSGTEDAESAFTLHGTPLPVHCFAILEYAKYIDDLDFLKNIYPRAQRQYRFLKGTDDGSTTARFSTGLTSTYDYFYNASGMDDYPPQAYVHERRIASRVTPCISASFVILTAKLLLHLAHQLGMNSDIEEYQADIKRLTQAFRTYAWDEDVKYFSYLTYNKTGVLEGILRDENGENLNQGIDGIYPMIAGAANEEQTQHLLGHLKNPEQLWSGIGITAVDQSAPYYDEQGYWNGTVWFPHQWFIWRSMMDLGEREFAWKIANTALETFEAETGESLYTYEFHRNTSGQGGFFHHFGGLTSPILIWFNAYFKAGKISSGYNTAVHHVVFSTDYSSCTFEFKKLESSSRDFLIVSLSKNLDYSDCTVSCNGHPLVYTERTTGTIEIVLPSDLMEGRINIQLS